MKNVFVILTLLLLSACAVLQKADIVNYKPELAKNAMQKEFDSIPPPSGQKITVAVYSFKDLTGQRRNIPNVASFSTAVTQGAEPLLIKALTEVGNGAWFDVVERVGIDDLIKERTIIKQMRDLYEGKNALPLPPMNFAGIIMEGGIIGYDSSVESGGAAYRYLGIGPQTQYSKDVITISLRAVSVATGKVLVSVTINKIVYSTADSIAILKFWKDGTQQFESEAGITNNEASTMAIKAAIEASVVELINAGNAKGVWQYKKSNIGNDK